MPKNLSIDALVKRFDTIKSNRITWDNHWQDCSDYALPQKAIVTKIRTPGTKLKTDIYDSTAIQAVQVLAAGLHSYLTNPTSRWFALGMKNKKLLKNKKIKDWLKDSEDGIFDFLNQSNFNQQIHECYIDFSVFGTSALYSESDIENGIVFHTRHMSEIYFLVNDKGKVDTVYRLFTFTARQAYQKWGDNAGKTIMDKLEGKQIEEPILFLHVVLPREERNIRKKDAKNMPFASLYIEPKTKKVLSEGGYEEFPFAIPRFYKVSDSEYAYSPVSMCLADIKMLNQMSKTTIKTAQKDEDPPLVLPHDGYLLPFKTHAGAVNYKLQGKPDDKIEILNVNTKSNLSLEMQNQRRESIKRTFFADLFLMLADNPKMTATEVIERVNEKMLILGPVLGRLMHELLDPIITRTFNILMRDGKLPPPPDELLEQTSDYQIEYISPLAKAQRASEARSITDLLLAIREMYEIEPLVKDGINYDEVRSELADIFNTSSKILRSDDEIKVIREERAKQLEIQQALEQANLGGEAMTKVGEGVEALKGGKGEAAKATR